MIAKTLAGILALAVLSTRADDIAAAATPDPDDDVLAAQDNDGLPAVGRQRPRVTPAETTPCSLGVRLPTRGRSALSPTAVRIPRLGADLLYALMSLQC